MPAGSPGFRCSPPPSGVNSADRWQSVFIHRRLRAGVSLCCSLGFHDRALRASAEGVRPWRRGRSQYGTLNEHGSELCRRIAGCWRRVGLPSAGDHPVLLVVEKEAEGAWQRRPRVPRRLSHKPKRLYEIHNAAFRRPRRSASAGRSGFAETEMTRPGTNPLSQMHKKSSAPGVCATASAQISVRTARVS
jgi:hypothetical protein